MEKLVSLTQQVSDCTTLLQDDKYKDFAIRHLSKISPEIQIEVNKLQEVEEVEVVVTVNKYYA